MAMDSNADAMLTNVNPIYQTRDDFLLINDLFSRASVRSKRSPKFRHHLSRFWGNRSYPVSPIPVSFPPFDGLEGLGSPDKCLHVVGLYLEHRGRVFHGRIKVRQLLVACRAVTVAFDCQRAPLVRQLTETLRVLFNRFL